MLDRCGDLGEVTSPIPELEITWSDMRTDELAWFPLSIAPVEATPYPTVIDHVWDYPLYPSTVEEALTEWSAKLGSELGISRFVGDAEYNRALMARYPATAHVHRAQQQVDGLRRKFLRDSDAAWKRMFPSDHEGDGYTLYSQLPPEYEQFRSALLTRLRQDELQVRGYHARFVLEKAGRAGIELDEAAVRAWVSGSGNE